MKRLRTVIPIDLSFFGTSDPATLLFTGAVADEIIEHAIPQFKANEVFQDDVNKFVLMAKSNTPVVNLAQAPRVNWSEANATGRS